MYGMYVMYVVCSYVVMYVCMECNYVCMKLCVYVIMYVCM